MDLVWHVAMHGMASLVLHREEPSLWVWCLSDAFLLIHVAVRMEMNLARVAEVAKNFLNLNFQFRFLFSTLFSFKCRVTMARLTPMLRQACPVQI